MAGRGGVVKVVGLDLSLTCTGVAVATQNGAITDRITSKPTPNATLADRAVRIGLITARVVDFVRGADLVIIEGPTYATSTGSQHDRSGLWWLVVNRLIAGTMPVVEVSPTTRCRYATGARHLGHPLETPLYANLDALPATHRAAMDAVTWPNPDRAA
jgi:crossover junction endodeoxyribonuclease RuvC